MDIPSNKRSKGVLVDKLPAVGKSSIDNILFRRFVENSQDGLTLIDKNKQVIYRSPSAERITGRKVQNSVMTSINELIHPEDRVSIKSFLDEISAHPGLSKTGEFRLKHADGHYIWLECAVTNYLNDPDVNAIVCNSRDVSEKKQAQGNLDRTLKELFSYKYALDESAIVAITDQKGFITYVNENFCRISKYSSTELIGHDHRVINSGYHDKAFIKDLWATIGRGHTWRGEIKNRAKDGSYYWVDTTIVPFLDESGKPYQYVSIRFDMTERKLNAERVAKSEQFLKTISDNLPAMIAYWSADMHCLFANKPFTDWHKNQGFEIIIGGHKYEFIDKLEFKEHEIHIKNVLNGEAQSFERTFIKQDGTTVYLYIQYLPDREGDIVKGFYSLSYDITEIKLAELEVAKMEALEERNTILESIGDAFFAVDNNWIVTYWNNTAEKVLMMPRKKILNKNLWEVFPDAINSEFYVKYHQAAKTNKAIHLEDFYSAMNKWFEVSAYPSTTGLSVYFKDITDRKMSDIRLKELNESLVKHAKELAISNAELEQFAYVASHDLQEPLRMVTSFMTQLEKKYGNVVEDRGRQYIHFAVDGAKRMRQIILDLLDFSRVGSIEDDMEQVDFNKLVGEVLALYRRQIEEEHATVLFENLPTIKTYKTPLRQIFQNLISNSLKYHKVTEPPIITIASTETETHFQFSVKDNGIGIAPDYFDKIFIIFQRLHTHDEYSGTGMGLAIAKKIVENLGGRIWVESEEGKGSTFYFTLLKDKP